MKRTHQPIPLLLLGCACLMASMSGCERRHRKFPTPQFNDPISESSASEAVAEMKPENKNAHLEEAAEQAQASLRNLGRALASQEETGSYIAIKKRFQEGLVEEWIWVNDLQFSGSRFIGYVANVPTLITEVAAGDQVAVPPDEVCDWMVVHPDGRLEGGFTIRLEVASMNAEDRDAFLKNSGLVIEP